MRSKNSNKSKKSAQKVAQASTKPSWQDTDSAVWLWVLAPLVLFVFMLNVRLFPMIAPNEEPKWAVLTLCGVWMGLAALWVLWRRSTLPEWSLSWSGLALLLFYVLLAIGAFIGPNQTEGLIRFSFWLSALGVFLTVCWAWRNIASFQAVWAWLITLGSFVFSFRYWQSYILDYGTPNYNVSVLFSPIGHVNFTGDVLVVLLPVLIYLLVTQSHAVLRILNWFSVTTIIAVLLVASGRGALGGMILAVVVLLVLCLRHRTWILAQNWKLPACYFPVILLLSSCVVSVFIYKMLPYHYRDLVRVSGTVESAIDMQVKTLSCNVVQPPLADMWNALKPVLGARTPMYASATAMALEKPLLGQGTGSFFAIYPSFSNHFPDFRDPLSNARTFTTNPHNIVLQIATQQGLIATILFMGLLLFFWWRLFISVWREWDIWQATGVAAITAALFDAMFNHVFFNPASMFVFALFAACWWAALKPMPNVMKLPALPVAALKPVILTLLLGLVLLSIWPTRWVISEWYAGSAMSHVRQPSVASLEYEKAYTWDKDNFRAVFGVAEIAYRQKRYDDAIAYLQHFEVIYPYNPPALNLLGAAYLMKGDYQQGIATFKRAIAILPDFKMAKQNVMRAQALLRQQQLRH